MARKRPVFFQPAQRRAIEIPNAPARTVTQDTNLTSSTGNKLIVGRSIRLRGEIAACDLLVVEGEVEASMASKVIEIAEGGVFKGTAEVETAEIHGRFDGTLSASKALRIYATGEVHGHVRYGSVEVATGGEIAGNIGILGASEMPSQLFEDATGTQAPETQTDTADTVISAEQTSSHQLHEAVQHAAAAKA